MVDIVNNHRSIDMILTDGNLDCNNCYSVDSEDINLVVTNITDVLSVNNYISTKLNDNNNIISLTITGCKLSEVEISDLFTNISNNSNILRTILRLTISYITVSSSVIALLKNYFNPFLSNNKLQEIRLIRCRNIDSITMTTLMDSLKENNNIRTIELTGNGCGDPIINPLLINISNYKNNIVSLGLRNNKLTANGNIVITTFVITTDIGIILLL